MASAEEYHVLDPSIAALSHDIKAQPNYHQIRWTSFVEATPGRADLIVRRAGFLFNGDTEVLRKVLTLMVEDQALAEKIDFAKDMKQNEPLPPVYYQLDELSVEQQLEALPPEASLPTSEDTNLAA